jgi:hypothetical protein
MTETKTARSLHLQLLAASRDHLFLVLRARMPPTSFMCALGGGVIQQKAAAAAAAGESHSHHATGSLSLSLSLSLPLSLSLSYLQVGDQPLLRHQRLTGLLKAALRGCPARLDLLPLQLRPQRRNARRSY